MLVPLKLLKAGSPWLQLRPPFGVGENTIRHGPGHCGPALVSTLRRRTGGVLVQRATAFDPLLSLRPDDSVNSVPPGVITYVCRGGGGLNGHRFHRSRRCGGCRGWCGNGIWRRGGCCSGNGLRSGCCRGCRVGGRCNVFRNVGCCSRCCRDNLPFDAHRLEVRTAIAKLFALWSALAWMTPHILSTAAVSSTAWRGLLDLRACCLEVGTAVTEVAAFWRTLACPALHKVATPEGRAARGALI
mmetsp:Transcript_51623/g.120444  ORF Transcript_51623/g.120444 Transcript_51623/m.120444 type:complete len:243 (+) Transcript_51623:1341-2069(+)